MKFYTLNDFDNFQRITFESNKYMSIDMLKKSWDKAMLQGSTSVELWSNKRRVLESPKFWYEIANLIKESTQLTQLKINTNIFNTNKTVFEKEVLRNLPEHVEVGLCDWGLRRNEPNMNKEWLVDYNIIYFYSNNIACLDTLPKAKNLKIVRLIVPCKKAVLKKLLKLYQVHSITLHLKEVTGNLKTLNHFLQSVQDKFLFPSEICLLEIGRKGEKLLAEETEKLNRRKEDSEFRKIIQNGFFRPQEVRSDSGLKLKVVEQFFELIKETGFLNEDEQNLGILISLRKSMILSKTKFEEMVEQCKAQGCIRTYKSRGKTFVVLMNEKFVERREGQEDVPLAVLA